MAEENINVQMRLTSVKEVSFMMSPGKIGDDAVLDDVQVGFSSQIQPDVENDKISLIFGCRYELNGDVVLECIYDFLFEVKDLCQFIEFKEDQNFIIKQIMPHFLNVAVGTMRGILVVKTAGSIVSKYPLPMIDANQLNASLSRPK